MSHIMNCRTQQFLYASTNCSGVWDDECNSSFCRVDESHNQQVGDARVLNLSLTTSTDEPTK